MRQWAYSILISLITVICVCFIALNMRSIRRVSSVTIELEQYKKAIADLEVQSKKASSERDLANRKVGRLEQEVSSLLEQRKADQQVIENLREMMQQNKPAQVRRDTKEQKVIEQKKQQSVEDVGAVREPPVQYNADMVREMMSSAGGLEETIRNAKRCTLAGRTKWKQDEKRLRKLNAQK